MRKIFVTSVPVPTAQICKVMEFLLNFPIARCNLGLWWFLPNLI